MKLTPAQVEILSMVSKRDWPTGEPRRTWFHKSSLAVIEKLKFVEERFPNILHLTDAGRAALAEQKDRTNE